MKKLIPAIAFNRAEIRKVAMRTLDQLRSRFTSLANHPTAENAVGALVSAQTAANGLVRLAYELARAEGNNELVRALQSLLDGAFPFAEGIRRAEALRKANTPNADPPSAAA